MFTNYPTDTVNMRPGLREIGEIDTRITRLLELLAQLLPLVRKLKADAALRPVFNKQGNVLKLSVVRGGGGKHFCEGCPRRRDC